MCASRGGAARSRFTRGLGGGAASSGRPRRRGCGTGTPSVRPETGPPAGCSQSPLGEPVAGGKGPGRPGLRGLRAPLGLPRAARAPGAPSPLTHSPRGCPGRPVAVPPTSGQRWRGWDAGTTPRFGRRFPTSGCGWKRTRAGLWAAQGGPRGQSRSRGDTRARPPHRSRAGVKMVRKERPEPGQRRRGGRGRGSPPAGP